MIAEMKEKLHFQVTFSLKSTSCLLKLNQCGTSSLTELILQKLYILFRSCDFEFGLTVVSISVTRCVAAREPEHARILSSVLLLTLQLQEKETIG